MAAILGRGFVSLRHVDHLLVMGSFLSSLELQAASLLIKLLLDAVAFLAQSLGVPVLSFLPIVLLLSLEPIILLLKSVLNIILHRLFSADLLLLHTPLHVFQFQL